VISQTTKTKTETKTLQALSTIHRENRARAWCWNQGKDRSL